MGRSRADPSLGVSAQVMSQSGEAGPVSLEEETRHNSKKQKNQILFGITKYRDSVSKLIDSIRVSGFRGLKNIEVLLPRVTVLVGPNKSGKTSLIKALWRRICPQSHVLWRNHSPNYINKHHFS